MGTMIDIRAEDGGSFKGYLALPGKGSGPGIVVLQEIFGVNANIRQVCDLYAEEGYVALAPDLFWRQQPGVDLSYNEEDIQKAFGFLQGFDQAAAVRDIAATIAALRAHQACKGKVGAIGFCLGGTLAYLAAARTDVDCAVGYYGVGIENLADDAKTISCPLQLHLGEVDKYTPPEVVEKIRSHLAAAPAAAEAEIFVYPGADHGFSAKGRPAYDKPASSMAHSRAIALFRRVMGPHYDLSALWDMHCYYEFGMRDVPETMKTMVDQPYVNHIPTMTGGVGQTHLARFYQHHFVNSNPADTKLIPVSRTIGADRVVDEMLFCFTHDTEIDWMLPGVKPTGKYVEVPLVAIVCFRGDKLYHEHIYWDQASVLVQIGVLDPATLPVAGVETARKLIDETLPSNPLMKRWAESGSQAAE
ncbi:MAG: dienelactone hydrolase family protein [Sneathiellaceae bacterium]